MKRRWHKISNSKNIQWNYNWQWITYSMLLKWCWPAVDFSASRLRENLRVVRDAFGFLSLGACHQASLLSKLIVDFSLSKKQLGPLGLSENRLLPNSGWIIILIKFTNLVSLPIFRQTLLKESEIVRCLLPCLLHWFRRLPWCCCHRKKTTCPQLAISFQNDPVGPGKLHYGVVQKWEPYPKKSGPSTKNGEYDNFWTNFWTSSQ